MGRYEGTLSFLGRGRHPATVLHALTLHQACRAMTLDRCLVQDTLL
jgi:hypothetical protein